MAFEMTIKAGGAPIIEEHCREQKSGRSRRFRDDWWYEDAPHRVLLAQLEAREPIEIDRTPDDDFVLVAPPSQRSYGVARFQGADGVYSFESNARPPRHQQRRH